MVQHNGEVQAVMPTEPAMPTVAKKPGDIPDYCFLQPSWSELYLKRGNQKRLGQLMSYHN